MDDLVIPATPPANNRRERPKVSFTHSQQPSSHVLDRFNTVVPVASTGLKAWQETATQAKMSGDHHDTSARSRSKGELEASRKSHFLQSSNSRRTKSNSKRFWTQEEDDLLRSMVKKLGAKNWKKISGHFESRTDVQCLHRWQKVLNPSLVKGICSTNPGMWTPEEDEKLRSLVSTIGPKNWSSIAKHFSGRIGKQCRERWHNHLNPDIRKDKWSDEEDHTLIHAQKVTDNAIKNHWNSTIKRKLRNSKHEKVSAEKDLQHDGSMLGKRSYLPKRVYESELMGTQNAYIESELRPKTLLPIFNKTAESGLQVRETPNSSTVVASSKAVSAVSPSIEFSSAFSPVRRDKPTWSSIDLLRKMYDEIMTPLNMKPDPKISKFRSSFYLRSNEERSQPQL